MPYASSYLGVQFLTACVCVINAKDFSLTGTKKKPIDLIGSSYLNQQALNLSNVDDPVKILGILFSYDRHKRGELNFYQML